MTSCMTLSSICFTLVGRLPLIMRLVLVVVVLEAFILLSNGRAIEGSWCFGVGSDDEEDGERVLET